MRGPGHQLFGARTKENGTRDCQERWEERWRYKGA